MGRYKLIYYPAGNQLQLFDLEDNPEELVDISGHAAAAAQRADMEKSLMGQLSGPDREWVVDGRLVGAPFEGNARTGNKGLSTQRGMHWLL